MDFGISRFLPTDYTGPQSNIAPLRSFPREPLTTDKKYPIGQIVILRKNPSTGTEGDIWYLSKFDSNGDAIWVQLAVGAGSPGIDSVTTDEGSPPVLPDANGNINLLGGNGVEVTGQGPGETVTAALDVPVLVEYGGTGRTSHTEYTVICGGTTTTDPQQSVVDTGTSQQVLTSTGPGALPVMADRTLSVLGNEIASSSATIEFLDLDNPNGIYLFVCSNVRPVTNNVNLIMEVSEDGGMNWISSGLQSSLLYNAYNSTTNVVSSSTAHVVLGDNLSGGSTSDNGFYVFYYSERGSSPSTVIGYATFGGQSSVMQHGRIASYLPISSGSVNFNSFRFSMTSGNIAVGEFSVYKLLKASPV